ncbi:hypothetical protein MHU86_6795 [Fragilaria crotonensis]|nr:hypothetical protein MHU86_6795 [Fragilaria crotonensis]
MEMDAADKLLPPMMAAGPVRGIIDAKTKELKRRIAEYLNITEDHILYISYPGDSRGIIPHFVAIDNATESLVLAIRGTNSLTGLHTDVRAQNIEFCGGEAHKGMADRACKLFENKKTMETINAFLEENPKFRLILTGHSLGAGVAGLLSIKLHRQTEEYVHVKRKSMHCFGFGCPPVFAPPENDAKVEGALSSSTWLVNRRDVIPFMSLDSISLLAKVLHKVDLFTRKVIEAGNSPLDLAKWNIPESLVREVTDGSNTLGPPINGKRLQIPGKRVLWMNDVQGQGDTRESNIVCCDPSDLANLAIRLSDQFIFDHMSPRYQLRIANLLPSKDGKR